MVEGRKRMVASFLVDYQLTDDEIAALRGEDVTEVFFAALARVQQIHGGALNFSAHHEHLTGETRVTGVNTGTQRGSSWAVEKGVDL